MLNQAKVPPSFWGAAVLYLTHILNATPSSSVSDTTSYAVWHGMKPDLSMYRVFGCRVHVNVLHKDHKNLEPHSIPCIFIEFSDGYKGWKVYNPVTKAVSVAQDVVFNESKFPGLSTKGSEHVPPPALTLHSLWPEGVPPEDNIPAGGNPPDNDDNDAPLGVPPRVDGQGEDNAQIDQFPGDHNSEDNEDDDENSPPGPSTPTYQQNTPAAHTPPCD